MQADEVARDGQAETRAAETAVGAALQLAEALEHRLPVLERNARAAVRDFQDDPLAAPSSTRSAQRTAPPAGVNLKAFESRLSRTR